MTLSDYGHVEEPSDLPSTKWIEKDFKRANRRSSNPTVQRLLDMDFGPIVPARDNLVVTIKKIDLQVGTHQLTADERSHLLADYKEDQLQVRQGLKLPVPLGRLGVANVPGLWYARSDCEILWSLHRTQVALDRPQRMHSEKMQTTKICWFYVAYVEICKNPVSLGWFIKIHKLLGCVSDCCMFHITLPSFCHQIRMDKLETSKATRKKPRLEREALRRDEEVAEVVWKLAWFGDVVLYLAGEVSSWIWLVFESKWQ